MEYVDGGKVVGVDLNVTISVGLIAGIIAGTAVKSILVTKLTILATAAGSAFGGPVGLGIGATIGVAAAGILVSKLTQFIVNSVAYNWSGNPISYKFDDVIKVWIPFRKNDISINIGTLGL